MDNIPKQLLSEKIQESIYNLLDEVEFEMEANLFQFLKRELYLCVTDTIRDHERDKWDSTFNDLKGNK